MKAKKDFDSTYIARHKEEFPSVEEVSCCCKGKRHSVSCGCLSASFIEAARRNLFCAISQCGNNADIFEQRVRNLGKYHARGIHQWSSGECDFHPLRVCSCGVCGDGELECEGKDYKSTHVLTCPLHALAYEVECNHRANHTQEIIDPELGRGHSNACEATFSVFPKFRPKDVGLQRLHNQASTNLALMQASMTYLYEKRGPHYHWVLDLFARMGLPLFDGMREQVHTCVIDPSLCVETCLCFSIQCTKDNKARMQKLRKQKEERVKKLRIQHKRKRVEEQSKRYVPIVLNMVDPQ